LKNIKEILKDYVNTLYDYQKIRIALDNRIRSGNYAESEHVVFENHAKRFEELEKEMEKAVSGLLKKFDIWNNFLKDVKGIGVKMGAILTSEIDIEKCSTVSSLWKYAGLDVEDGHAPKPVKGQKLHYNKYFRSKLLGVLGPSFLKCNSPYRKFYDNYKNRLESKKWGKSKGHRHNASIRYMIKMFLIDLYNVWRELKGLSIRKPYNDEYGKGHHE